MIRAKHYKTVTKFVKVMPRILWPLFFPDTVYITTHRFAIVSKCLPRRHSTIFYREKIQTHAYIINIENKNIAES